MADVTPTVRKVRDNTVVFTYAALSAANAAGAPIGEQYADYADRTVQFSGTFDSATCVWQGGNDGSTWGTLNDLQGSGISKTAAAIEGVAEGALFQRPSTSGGGGSQLVDCIVVCRKGPRPIGAV